MFIPNIQLTDVLCSFFTWNKRIDLVLSSPKYILSLLSTSQSKIFPKSLLSCFSISATPLCCYKMHESSAYKTNDDVTASGISLT